MAQKSYRVIAPNAALKHLRTVNVVVTPPTAKQVKTAIQFAGAPPVGGVIETVMIAASLTPGLPTIHIAGYAAPN